MALRILFLIIGATIAVNLVLASVSLITGVNLYKKYGKQIQLFTICSLDKIIQLD